MITAYASLLPYIMPELKGCSENTALLSVRRAARDFFNITEVWQKELATIAIVAGTAQYALDPDENPTAPDGEPEIRRIEWLKINGAVQDGSTYDLTANTLVAVPTTTYSVTFKSDYVPSTSWAATTSTGLDIKVVLVPDWNTNYLPSFLRTRWGEAIAAGALANLLTIPNAPWARPDRGMINQEKWNNYVASAVKERYTGRIGGSLKMVSPYAFDI